MDRDPRAEDHAHSSEGRAETSRALRRSERVHESLSGRQQLAGHPRRADEGGLRRLADRGNGSALPLRPGSAVLRHGASDGSADFGEALSVEMSRRQFLSSTARAGALMISSWGMLMPPSEAPARAVRRWLLLPIPGPRILPESFPGYASALPAEQCGCARCSSFLRSLPSPWMACNASQTRCAMEQRSSSSPEGDSPVI